MSAIDLYISSSTAAFGFARPLGDCAPRGMSAFGQYGPSITVNFGFGQPYRCCGPRWLSILRLLDLNRSAAFGPRYDCQHTAYTAPTVSQLSALANPTALVAQML